MNAMILTCTIIGLFSAFHGNLSASDSAPGKDGENDSFKNLPAIDEPFKIAPYVRAAALIQKMGKENGCKQLVKLAERDDEGGQVAVLCRLLFSKKEKMLFRPPRLGAPIYMGGTSAAEWSSLPIEIVDDVPFFIVLDYNLLGEAESSLHYFNYCLKNCEWSKTRIDQVNEKTIEKALKKLLASRKWKRALSNDEQQYLIDQTK